MATRRIYISYAKRSREEGAGSRGRPALRPRPNAPQCCASDDAQRDGMPQPVPYELAFLALRGHCMTGYDGGIDYIEQGILSCEEHWAHGIPFLDSFEEALHSLQMSPYRCTTARASLEREPNHAGSDDDHFTWEENVTSSHVTVLIMAVPQHTILEFIVSNPCSVAKKEDGPGGSHWTSPPRTIGS